MFTPLFAVIWQFILFVIIVSAGLLYIGYWGLVALALIVYAP
jgi:hypothetical protein